MKYLKKFNEELNSQTYLRASYKLKNFGNKSSLDRADKLKDWAIKTEERESIEKWAEHIKILSKFGSIKCNVGSELVDFYFDFSFDSTAFEDTLDDAKSEDPDNFNSTIYHSFWLAPTTIEGVHKCLKTVDAVDYFSNGQFRAGYISIDYAVVNGAIEFRDFSLYYEDEVNFTLTSNGASKVLNMLAKIYSDRGLNYPSSNTRYDNEYEHLNSSICIENGFSVDYGFELSDAAEYIKTVPKQKLLE